MQIGGEMVTSAGGLDVLLVVLDPSGGPIVAERFGDSDLQEAFGVAVDPSGRVWVTGVVRGTTNFGSGPLTANEYDVFIAGFDY
jgi:hypothetical protein